MSCGEIQYVLDIVLVTQGHLVQKCYCYGLLKQKKPQQLQNNGCFTIRQHDNEMPNEA